MNVKLGIYSSIAVTTTVTLFAVALVIGNLTMSYSVSLLLSWGYILLACSFASKTVADRKAFAYGGLIFACLYGVFVDMVYFTQLTTVANQTASADALQILSYQSSGSLMFNFDLFGYGMMAIFTFLIGVTIIPESTTDKALKALLMIHGIFAFSSILMPMFNVFNSNMGNNGNIIGIVALLFWCAYFIPVGILSSLHFRKSQVS